LSGVVMILVCDRSAQKESLSERPTFGKKFFVS